eukprot:TRINITY_DN109070_c0_g1_i1.p1 TRINITY_DN109070_c0_g1~~TRINITY_DN109070_c0_g1_i1.p1  ORF type:complete len:536 (+),score=100.70 TRINITY_DN109070_c0_g1_i1:92-1699(+)
MVHVGVALAATGVVAMFAANASMIPETLVGLPCFPRCFLSSLPADVQANLLLLACMIVVAVMLDARALLHMFVSVPNSEVKTSQQKLTSKLSFSSQSQASHFDRLLVSINWAAGSGILCSALKLSVTTPLPNYNFQPRDLSFQMAHDVIIGDLQLNPLVRAGAQQRWESVYGIICGFYLVLTFGFSSTRRCDFILARFFFGKGVLIGVTVLIFMAFAGLFGRGLWPVAFLLIAGHVALLWVACRLVVCREVTKGGRGRASRAANKLMCVLKAAGLLFVSNMLLAVHMAVIYALGKNTLESALVIYGPITLCTLVLMRDENWVGMIWSCMLAVAHGIAHVVYPFLDEIHGVVTSVDVWQDQLLHAGQAFLFSALWFNKASFLGRASLLVFCAASLCNAIIGYLCWGKSCHMLYIWMALVPSLASGLHFAYGCLYYSCERVAAYGFLLQGASSITTYFLFKRSDDMLKLFALCRFFEVYFIVPHLVGLFYGRFLMRGGEAQQPWERAEISEILGIDSTPRSPESPATLDGYFHPKQS